MPARKAELVMKDVDGLVMLVRGFRGGKLEVPEDPGAQGKKTIRKTLPRHPVRQTSFHLSLLSVPPRGLPENSISAGEAIAVTARTTFQRLCPAVTE